MVRLHIEDNRADQKDILHTQEHTYNIYSKIFLSSLCDVLH